MATFKSCQKHSLENLAITAQHQTLLLNLLLLDLLESGGSPLKLVIFVICWLRLSTPVLTFCNFFRFHIENKLYDRDFRGSIYLFFMSDPSKVTEDQL